MGNKSEKTPITFETDAPEQNDFDRRRFLSVLGLLGLTHLTAAAPAEKAIEQRRPVFIVPNLHPASCGWLTTFSKERVYCTNSYLNHLDRVRDDPEYEFVLSEVNNIIAIMNFQPSRIPGLKASIAEGRVELVNAYFLESTTAGNRKNPKPGISICRQMGLIDNLARADDSDAVVGVDRLLGFIGQL